MPKLQRLRTLAFHKQAGRCHYCGLAMWLHSPAELSLRPRTAQPLRCTAEHLIARQDGGRDTSDNIVAACLLCNGRRHKRKVSPAAGAYRTLVRRRLAKGKWLPESLKPNTPIATDEAKP